MAASAPTELEDQAYRADAELGAIRRGQLEEADNGHTRERAADVFRKEVRRRLAGFEGGLAEMRGNVGGLETSMDKVHGRLCNLEAGLAEVKVDEIQRADRREQSAAAFRKEIRADVAELRTDMAEVKTAVAQILELLSAKG